MSNIIKSNVKNSVYLNLPNIFSTMLNIFAIPIILKSIPTHDYGQYQLVLAIQVWILGFSGINIITAAKRGIAKNQDGTLIYALLTRLKLLVPIVIVVSGVWVYLYGFYNNTISKLLVIVFIYSISGQLFELCFSSYLIAKQQFREWCIWNIVISPLSLISATIIAYYKNNIVYFVITQLGVSTAISFVLLVYVVIKNKILKSYMSGEIDKDCKSYGMKVMLADIIQIISGKISYFIIGPFLGFTNLAVYSISTNLSEKCAEVMKSVAPALYAKFAKIDKEDVKRVILRDKNIILIYGSLLTVIFVFAGVSYIHILLPSSFVKAKLYVVLLSMGLPAGLFTVVMNTFLESHLKYVEVNKIRIISSVFRIVLILVFGYFWKILGICMAILIFGWFNCILYYYYIFKKKEFTN